MGLVTLDFLNSQLHLAEQLEIVCVPLLLRYPRLLNPQVSSLAVDLTDLMPTLLEIVGQPVPSSVQGQSLVPYLTGKSSPAADRTYCFCERVAVNAEHERDEGRAEGLAAADRMAGARRLMAQKTHGNRPAASGILPSGPFDAGRVGF